MKTNKSIMGALAGVAVGTALGVLFAPDKGTNTRKKIAKKSKEAKNKAMVSLNELTDEVAQKYNSIIAKGEELAQEGKENVKEGIKTVREQMNK